MKRLFWFSALISLVLIVILTGCGGSSPAPSSSTVPPTSSSAPAPTTAATTTPSTPAAQGKVVELKAIMYLPINSTAGAPFKEYVQAVNDAAKGKMVINITGGPEVVPAPEQAGAVGRGMADITFCSSTYHQKIVPEVAALTISQFSPKEERDAGFLDLIRNLHKQKMNLMVIGRGIVATSQDNIIWTTRSIKDPKVDFKGAKFRSGGTRYDAIYKVLGITSINLDWPDVYSALDRKLIEGLAIPKARIDSDKYYEILKYAVLPGFYQNDTLTMMNLDKWNSLPKELQDILLNVQAQLEPSWLTKRIADEDKLMQKFAAAGMQTIQLSPDNAKWLTEVAYTAAWEDLKKDITSDAYTQLQKMLLK